MRAHRKTMMEWLQATDVTQSDDFMAIGWLETAAAELEALERRR